MDEKCVVIGDLEGGDKFTIPGEVARSGSDFTFIKLTYTFIIKPGMRIPNVRKKEKGGYIKVLECVNAVREEGGFFVTISPDEPLIEKS